SNELSCSIPLRGVRFPAESSWIRRFAGRIRVTQGNNVMCAAHPRMGSSGMRGSAAAVSSSRWSRTRLEVGRTSGFILLDPRLIKESFTAVEPVSDQVAGYFYARLFLENPGVREMFPPAMDLQRERLFGALVRIVQGIDRPEFIANFLEQL